MAASLPVTLSNGSNSGSSNILDMVKSGQGLLDIFKGSTTNTSETTQTNISPEGVSAILQQILGGTSGLASVASGQKAAGLYNSSTNSLLTNDLLSRVTGEVAARTAPTTRIGSAVKQPQLSPFSSVLGLAATQIGGKVLKATGLDKQISDVFSKIGGKVRDATYGTADEQLAQANSSAYGELGDFSGFTGEAASEATGAATSVGSDLGFSTGFEGIGSELFGAGADAALGAGADLGFSTGFADIGAEAFGDGFAGFGAAEGAGLGAEAAGASFLEEAGPLLAAASVICTELHRQGIMSTELYVKDVAYAQQHLSRIMLRGYRIWAIPYVRLMRKSKLATRVAAFFAIKRAQSLTGNSIFGSIFRRVFEPICFLIGLFVNNPDHSVLYNGEHP